MILLHIIQILGLVVPVLISVAFLTLAERKVMAGIQRRKGPNVVGFFGVFQPFADALKLLMKEPLLPSQANTFLYLFAPILTFALSLILWAVMPFQLHGVLSDLNLGIMYIFAISSLGVYGVMMAGWASNSKYAFLGALRSAAQMVSYEVSIGFILLTVILCAGSLNLTDIVEAQQNVWFMVPLFPLFIMFFISCIAETNRAPFDLPEAEAELVAGFFTEYASMGFALFFLGEYSSMIFMSAFTVLLFCGGWLAPFWIDLNIPLVGAFWFGLKTCFFLFVYIWVRASLPRYRYDQLMRLSWKCFLPLSVGYVILTAGILFGFDGCFSGSAIQV